MNGRQLAEAAAKKHGTRDVYGIAAAERIAVVFGRWHPVTYGEFDRSRREIVVNRNAPVSAERIIAHELGHLFAGPGRGPQIEAICEEFAEALLEG